MLSEGQFGDFSQRIQTPGGGFTVNTKTGLEPTSGISVGVAGHESKGPASDVTSGSIRSYVTDKQKALEQHPQRHLGGWEDQGEGYLDVSKVHNDTSVGRVKSRIAMMRNSQIAAYDIGAGATITNPFHPANVGPDMTAPTDRETKRNWASMGRHPTHRPDQ